MTTQTTTLRGRKAVYARRCDTLESFQWLGKCSRMSGVESPRGDKTITYRHSTEVGKYEADQQYTGVPGATTSSLIMKETIRSRAYGDLAECAWDYDIRSQSCGRVDDPFNWDMIKRLCCAEPTSVSTDDETAYTGDDEGETLVTMALSTMTPFVMIYRVIGQRVENYDLSDWSLTRVRVSTPGHCADQCGPATDCTLYAAVTADSPGNPPYFGKSTDGGQTWVLSPITVFNNATYIDDVACLGDMIIAVASGEPGYAYSWDGGTTWGLIDETDVPTFATNAPTRVAIQSRSQVLFGGENGYMWLSDDGGVSCSVVEDGSVTSGDIKDLQFINDLVVFACGNANSLKKSQDGGSTWAALTLPVAKAADNVFTVWAFNEYLILIGYGTTGGLYYSLDGGLTWNDDASIAASTKITGISVCDCGVIFASGQAAGVGVVYRNIDGGASARWEAVSIAEPGTLYYDVACCGPNEAVAVGAPTGIYTAGLVTKIS